VNSASELIHSHWFFEIYIYKKLFTLVNSAIMEPCSTVEVSPKREATKCCFSETCGAMWVLRAESTFIFLTKRLLVWLPVNLTRNHVTKRALNVSPTPFLEPYVWTWAFNPISLTYVTGLSSAQPNPTLRACLTCLIFTKEEMFFFLKACLSNTILKNFSCL